MTSVDNQFDTRHWRLGRWGVRWNGGRQDPAGISTLDYYCDGRCNLNYLPCWIGNSELNAKTRIGLQREETVLRVKISYNRPGH